MDKNNPAALQVKRAASRKSVVCSAYCITKVQKAKQSTIILAYLQNHEGTRFDIHLDCGILYNSVCRRVWELHRKGLIVHTRTALDRTTGARAQYYTAATNARRRAGKSSCSISRRRGKEGAI